MCLCVVKIEMNICDLYLYTYKYEIHGDFPGDGSGRLAGGATAYIYMSIYVLYIYCIYIYMPTVLGHKKL